MNRTKGDIVYVSHGGGPLPLLGDPSHGRMVEFLEGLGKTLGIPDEILVVSAHWEQADPTVCDAGERGLLYDYYGFPPESYRIEYPARGNPGLAGVLREILESAGFEPREDRERGLDHGVFVPLKIMYPDGGIPVTQLSLLKGLDPARHYELGAALRPLRDRGCLVVGSGFSFHNMRLFTMDPAGDDDPLNDGFQDWLVGVCAGTVDEGERRRALVDWAGAPGARHCHPREEHLLPLHVCAGLAGTAAEVVFDDSIAGKRAVGFRWP